MKALKRGLFFTLAVLILFGIIAAVVVFHYAQPQQIARLLVEFSADRLHLELRFAGEPRYTFWPQLSLNLDEPSMHLHGQPQAMLSAHRLRIELPWSSLRNSRLQVDAVELDRPNLDLDLTKDWLAISPSDATLPDVHARLRVGAGVLRRGATTLANGVTLDGDIGLRELDAWWRSLGQGDDARHLLPPVHGVATAAEVTLGALRMKGLHVDSESP
ncbi:MAG: AsmA family protein [Tahibacter sp.]